MPGFWLKRQILLNLPSDNLEVYVADSIDFMVERVSFFLFVFNLRCENNDFISCCCCYHCSVVAVRIMW